MAYFGQQQAWHDGTVITIPDIGFSWGPFILMPPPNLQKKGNEGNGACKLSMAHKTAVLRAYCE